MFLRGSFGVTHANSISFVRGSFGVPSVFLRCSFSASEFLRCSFGVSSELQNEIFLASLIICLMNRRLVVYLLESVPFVPFEKAFFVIMKLYVGTCT
jgi:hypothetical protein